MIRRAITIACSAVVVMCATVHADGVQGVYAVGGMVEYGNLYSPPSAASAAATMISYHEYGGLLGKALLIGLEGPSMPHAYTTSDCEAAISAHRDSCTVTTHEPSAADIAQWREDAARFDATRGKAILAGEYGQELFIDVALRQLGGSASGVILKLYRPLGRYFAIAPLGVGWLTFHNLPAHMVTADSGELRATDTTKSFTFIYAGMPIRFATPLVSHVGVHLELDLNILSLFIDQPSPVRFGFEWAGPHVLVKVDAMSTFRGGAELAAGAVLAF